MKGFVITSWIVTVVTVVAYLLSMWIGIPGDLIQFFFVVVFVFILFFGKPKYPSYFAAICVFFVLMVEGATFMLVMTVLFFAQQSFREGRRLQLKPIPIFLTLNIQALTMVESIKHGSPHALGIGAGALTVLFVFAWLKPSWFARIEASEPPDGVTP